jgi:hypothetical protein
LRACRRLAALHGSARSEGKLRRQVTVLVVVVLAQAGGHLLVALTPVYATFLACRAISGAWTPGARRAGEIAARHAAQHTCSRARLLKSACLANCRCPTATRRRAGVSSATTWVLTMAITTDLRELSESQVTRSVAVIILISATGEVVGPLVGASLFSG